MDVIPQAIILYKKVKILLIFFCASLFFSCLDDKILVEPAVKYTDGHAVSVSFKAGQSLKYSLFLKQNDLAPILGESTYNKGIYTFTPVVAFTAGEEYEVLENGKLIASFRVKRSSMEKAPELVAIYPSSDSVPQNLLKMYFVFSEPMQYSKSALDFITVYDNTAQKEVDVFLEMQTELWNQKHTRLTLWLDPGRIKTDLIPNREKGLPLLQNHSYTILIDSLWTSAQGQSLNKKYSKRLNVLGKDTQRPNPRSWNVIVPKSNTATPLEIYFNEPMDAILALETIQIRNSEMAKSLEGTVLAFKKTNQNLRIQARLQNGTLGKYSVRCEFKFLRIWQVTTWSTFLTQICKVQTLPKTLKTP